MVRFFLFIILSLTFTVTTAKTEVNTFVNDSIVELKTDSLRINSFQSILEQQFQKYDHVRYRYAGRDENGFDCSGFVSTVFKNLFEMKLPRSSRDMVKVGEEIKKEQLQTGDLVIFKPPGYSHVGIYLGDGIFMHSSTKLGVTKSSIDSTYWKKYYKTSRRILNPTK